MDTLSPRLNLPHLKPNRTQKYVPYNEVLSDRDLVIHASVVSRTLVVPPAGSSAVDAYLIPDDWRTGGYAEASLPAAD